MQSKRAAHPAAFDSAQAAWTDMSRLFSRENLMALALCAIMILVIIATTDSAPQWIYQGF